jgi:hypothetical protein
MRPPSGFWTPSCEHEPISIQYDEQGVSAEEADLMGSVRGYPIIAEPHFILAMRATGSRSTASAIAGAH